MIELLYKFPNPESDPRNFTDIFYYDFATLGVGKKGYISFIVDNAEDADRIKESIFKILPGILLIEEK